jgi:Fic family protein
MRNLEPKEAHIEFEYIHPFVDGNGRVGRMVYNAHRLLLGQPIHIIEESEKNEYYKWF